MKKPLLVMFVGVPGSGKTTFARQLAAHLNAVLLNSDALRMAMWRDLESIQATHSTQEERDRANSLTFGAMNYAAARTQAAGYSVVYDCNANHMWERQEKHDIANDNDGLSVVVRIRVPYALSLDRIQSREVTHDQRRITADRAQQVLDRFVAEIEEPSADENVIEISGVSSFDEQLESFQSQLSRIRDDARAS